MTRKLTRPHLPPGRRPRSVESRLRTGVDRSGGPDACWPWMGYKDRNGYGQVKGGSSAKGTKYTALTHRLAYVLEHGDPPTEKPCILHTCGERACCNPRHLQAGTRADAAVGRRRDRASPMMLSSQDAKGT